MTKKAIAAQRAREVAKAATKKEALKKNIVDKTVKIKEKPRSAASLKADKLLGGKTTAQLKKKLEPVTLPKGDPTKIKTPRKLNECVDLYEAARRARLEIEKSADGYRELESRMREHLIENVSKGDAAGVTGKTHRVTVKLKAVPKIGDEGKFLAAAKKKGNEDLVKMVPNLAAINERWESGKSVPGVESFNVVTLSLNKL